MKKILITGANSYIGTSFKKWMEQWKEEYEVHTIDMKNPNWREKDFSGYDVVFHVAGIVHKREKPEMESMYFKINRDLPVEVANVAKTSGVKQIIFMSTMAVYGEKGEIGRKVIITRDTNPKPNTYYGKSKLEAEKEINKLADTQFNVVILRPPIVYGPNCPGNYSKLEKLALKTPIFPMIDNQRSMLNIDKLCKNLKKYIDDEDKGLFLPQDDEYVNTSLLVKKIAKKNGRRIFLSKLLGNIIKLVLKKIDLINKIFGNLIYEK